MEIQGPFVLQELLMVPSSHFMSYETTLIQYIQIGLDATEPLHVENGKQIKNKNA
jgi:hypothetical protein